MLASGRGSNFKALWQASQDSNSLFEILCLLSDNKTAPALQFAKEQKMPAHYAHEENELLELLQKYNPDLICLAGYMKILSKNFIERWDGKIINIHPSLLPKYKGLNTHQRAIEAKDKEHGATVHYVNESLDSGEIIQQCRIPILEDDTPAELAARLLPYEHELYVKTVKELAKSH